MSARGELLLFADADGATRFCDIQKLEACIAKITEVRNYIRVLYRTKSQNQHLTEDSFWFL